jgi:hypothetical protein
MQFSSGLRSGVLRRLFSYCLTLKSLIRPEGATEHCENAMLGQKIFARFLG